MVLGRERRSYLKLVSLVNSVRLSSALNKLDVS